MNDEQLRELLSKWQAQPASDDFTPNTMRRLASGPRPTRHRKGLQPRLVWAALLVMIGALLSGLWWLEKHRDRTAAQVELASLRQEYSRLTQDLDAIQRKQKPIVYLGGNDRVDYVVDLRQLERKKRSDAKLVPVKFNQDVL